MDFKKYNKMKLTMEINLDYIASRDIFVGKVKESKDDKNYSKQRKQNNGF